jgi:TPR repeat protein
MKRIAHGMVLAAVALGLSGCSVRQFMGISTRTPVTAEEQARLDAALASGSAVGSGCPWRGEGAKPVNVPCDALPLPRLASLAGMDHKPALLELGIRFEEGRGVARDWDKAELAYRLAAWQNSYIAGQQVAGLDSATGNRFDPIMVPGAPGLDSAQARLAGLRARKKTQ